MMKMERLKCELKELLTKRIQTEKTKREDCLYRTFLSTYFAKKIKQW